VEIAAAGWRLVHYRRTKDTLDCTGNWSHCTGAWNICAVDFVKVVGQQDPNKDQPILAPADGTIIQASHDPNGGDYLQIEHGAGGRVSLFLHLDKPLFTSTTLSQYKRDHSNELPTVKQGDVIGLMGYGAPLPPAAITCITKSWPTKARPRASVCWGLMACAQFGNGATRYLDQSTGWQRARTGADRADCAAPAVAPPRTRAGWRARSMGCELVAERRTRVIGAMNTIHHQCRTGGSSNAGL